MLLRVLSRLLALLPYGGTRLIGNFIGSTSKLFRTRAARVTEANIGYCFPELSDEAQSDLVKQSLRHTGRLLAESGIIFHWSPEKLRSLITATEGFEAAEAALQAKRGVLVLVPHYGNWELFALHFGSREFIALYDPPRIAAFDRMIKQSRQRTGAVLLPIDAHGVRELLQALKQGKPTVILPDQVPPRSAGVYAPFFKRQALTMTFAHRLINSTNPLVIFGTCHRGESGFTISFTRAPDEIYAADVHSSVAAMNGAIEELVRADPAQYQWEYKRFKKQASGTMDPYRD